MEARRLKDDELQHHGVKGQRWGVRRYQNANGTLTAAGKKRYYKSDGSLTNKGRKEYYTQHFENELKKAKTKDKKTYILRSEARKNALDVQNHARKSGIAVGAGMAAGVAGGVVTALTGGTTAPIAAGIIGATVATAMVTSLSTAGKAYTKSIENAKLADLADKYGIEDIKVRNQ